MWYLHKIPKTLFLYWGRNKKLSFMRYMTVYSFAKLNPDWNIKIYYPDIIHKGETWLCDAQKGYNYQDKDWFNKLREIEGVKIIKFTFSDMDMFEGIGKVEDIPEVFKSDILRLYLLSTQGGVWTDFDIIFIKPINILSLNQFEYKDVDIILCYSFVITRNSKGKIVKKNPRRIANRIGFIGGTNKKSLFFSEMIKLKEQIYDFKNYQSLGANLFNAFCKFDILNEEMMFQYKDVNIFNLPLKSIYPYSHTGKLERFYNGSDIEVDNQTIGIHWYGGGRVSSKYDNIINDSNIYDYNKSYILRRMGEIYN